MQSQPRDSAGLGKLWLNTFLRDTPTSSYTRLGLQDVWRYAEICYDFPSEACDQDQICSMYNCFEPLSRVCLCSAPHMPLRPDSRFQYPIPSPIPSLPSMHKEKFRTPYGAR